MNQWAFKELFERKQKLEKDIACSVRELLDAFKKETSYYPSRIDIRIIAVTNVSGTTGQFILDGCEIEIKI